MQATLGLVAVEGLILFSPASPVPMPAAQKRSLSADRQASSQGASAAAKSKVKRQRVRQRRRGSGPAIVDAINSVLEQSQSDMIDSSDSEFEELEREELRLQVQTLQTTVSSQQEEISSLKAQLLRLLSFLGLSNDNPRQQMHDDGPSTSSSTVAADNAGGEAGPSDDISGGQFTTVTRRKRHGNGVNTENTTLNDVVLSAMYTHARELQRKANSIVISGLQECPGKPDTVTVIDLCRAGLGISPDIKTVKRIGRDIDGRVKPLLVTLNDSHQAEQLVSNAKRLRQSADPVVREKVFINRNMTRVEAKAAYEERCRRRQQNTQQTGTTTTTTTANTATRQPLPTISERLTNLAAAAGFNPTPMDTTTTAAAVAAPTAATATATAVGTAGRH